jgi:hypothetical protein
MENRMDHIEMLIVKPLFGIMALFCIHFLPLPIILKECAWSAATLYSLINGYFLIFPRNKNKK